MKALLIFAKVVPYAKRIDTTLPLSILFIIFNLINNAPRVSESKFYSIIYLQKFSATTIFNYSELEAQNLIEQSVIK